MFFSNRRANNKPIKAFLSEGDNSESDVPTFISGWFLRESIFDEFDVELHPVIVKTVNAAIVSLIFFKFIDFFTLDVKCCLRTSFLS